MAQHGKSSIAIRLLDPGCIDDPLIVSIYLLLLKSYTGLNKLPLDWVEFLHVWGSFSRQIQLVDGSCSKQFFLHHLYILVKMHLLKYRAL